MSDTDNAVARAARVAPSAMNSQPWVLNFKSNSVLINYKGRGLAQGILKKKLNKIDLGIVTAHVELALANEGKAVQSIKVNDSGKNLSVEVCWE
jgi:molybdopterin-binding protein